MSILSEKDLKRLWRKIQNLPYGVREKILYRLPLFSLSLLCRKSSKDFVIKARFWHDKLVFDELILDLYSENWLKWNRKQYNSLAHFFEVFAEKDSEKCWTGREELRMKFRYAIQRDFVKEERIWNNWHRKSHTLKDLLFQQRILKIREKTPFLVLDFNYLSVNHSRFSTYLDFLIYLNIERNNILDSFCQTILPHEQGGFQTVNRRSKMNYLRRLYYLVRTGDVIKINHSSYFLFKDSDSNILLIPFIQSSYFPFEAFHFITKNKLFDKEQVSNSYHDSYSFSGYSRLTEENVVRIYDFTTPKIRTRRKALSEEVEICYSEVKSLKNFTSTQIVPNKRSREVIQAILAYEYPQYDQDLSTCLCRL